MLLLGGLVTLAAAQILMRNIFDSGLPWADPLLRLIVLWLTLAGALAATRDNKHIRIDLLSRFLPKRLAAWMDRLTSAFAAIVCALLAWHGGRLVWFEYQDGTLVAPGIPAWTAELIIPLGFGLMALRFALRALCCPMHQKSRDDPHRSPAAVLALLGAPLFTVIGAGALLGFHRSEVDLSVVAIEFYRIAETPILLAIPLFTFAGYLLSESQAPQRLVRLSRALLGWMPGGLALVALAACAFFTAFTGASGVTIVALGALLVPALRQGGYGENFSLGLVTTSGSLGLLFAPALPLILYAVVAQQLGIASSATVENMFLAGILPGAADAGAARRLQHLVRARGLALTPFTWREAGAALREAGWELPLPLVVLGGIYGGWLRGLRGRRGHRLLRLPRGGRHPPREIPLRKLPQVMRESMVLVGGILVILGVSLASTNYMIDAEVPARLFEAIRGFVDSRIGFLLFLNIFLLALGTMLDIFSALVLIVPLLLPVALGYGVHPVHLGIIFLANMQIGYFTPPVGMNLFIASYRFDKPVLQLYRATLPWFLILLCALMLIPSRPPAARPRALFRPPCPILPPFPLWPHPGVYL